MFNHFFYLLYMTNSFRRSLYAKAISPLDESRPLWSRAYWQPVP